MLCLLSGWTKRNKPHVLNGWAEKRYSAHILPYLAGKLTEQGFITFLQRLTHAHRHKITHMHTLHLQADGYTNTHAFTNCAFFLSFFFFEAFDLRLLKDSIFECTTRKQIRASSSQVPLFGQLVSVWGKLCKKRDFVMIWGQEPPIWCCLHS